LESATLNHKIAAIAVFCGAMDKGGVVTMARYVVKKIRNAQRGGRVVQTDIDVTGGRAESYDRRLRDSAIGSERKQHCQNRGDGPPVRSACSHRFRFAWGAIALWRPPLF